MDAAPRPTRWPLFALALLAVPAAASAQPPDATLALQLDSLSNIPIPGSVTIQPRVFAAYGTFADSARRTDSPGA